MAVTAKITVFWDLVSHSSVDKYQDFGETYCLYLLGNLRMEAAGSSKILVCIFQITWCHIPESNKYSSNSDIQNRSMKRNNISYMLYLYCRQCTPPIQHTPQNSELCQNQNLILLVSANWHCIKTKDILEVNLPNILILLQDLKKMD